MKTIKLFGLLLMATLVFAACSKDDDETPVDVSGTKWETNYYKSSAAGQSGELTTKSELESAYKYDVLEFKADEKFYINSYYTGTWKQSGSKVEILDADGEVEDEYTVSGSTLIQSYSYSFMGVNISEETRYAMIK